MATETQRDSVLFQENADVPSQVPEPSCLRVERAPSTTWQNRRTDTELLIQFIKDSGTTESQVLGAIARLEKCHAKGLQDYSSPVKKQQLYKTARYRDEFVAIVDARLTESGWEYNIRKQNGTLIRMVHEFDLTDFCL